jgi:hypothetical protein
MGGYLFANIQGLGLGWMGVNLGTTGAGFGVAGTSLLPILIPLLTSGLSAAAMEGLLYFLVPAMRNAGWSEVTVKWWESTLRTTAKIVGFGVGLAGTLTGADALLAIPAVIGGAAYGVYRYFYPSRSAMSEYSTRILDALHLHPDQPLEAMSAEEMMRKYLRLRYFIQDYESDPPDDPSQPDKLADPAANELMQKMHATLIDRAAEWDTALAPEDAVNLDRPEVQRQVIQRINDTYAALIGVESNVADMDKMARTAYAAVKGSMDNQKYVKDTTKATATGAGSVASSIYNWFTTPGSRR